MTWETALSRRRVSNKLGDIPVERMIQGEV